jgi:hypothetical protein
MHLTLELSRRPRLHSTPKTRQLTAVEGFRFERLLRPTLRWAGFAPNRDGQRIAKDWRIHVHLHGSGGIADGSTKQRFKILDR